MNGASDEYEPEWMDAEDPLFILYTRFVYLLLWLPSKFTNPPMQLLCFVTGFLACILIFSLYFYDSFFCNSYM